MNVTETEKQIRRIVIEQAYRSQTGHIGSALSVAPILAALYAPDGGILRAVSHDDAMRDRFILSKGHAALALYAALFCRGWLMQDDLDSYCTPGSEMYEHPSHKVNGVEFSTGSLGMGLSFGCGCALADKRAGNNRITYVLISDAELNEGSTWEAIMFAGHHKLNNLVCIVDANEQQAMGRTRDTIDMGGVNGVREKFRVFGWCDDPELWSRSLGDMMKVELKPSGFSNPTCHVVPTIAGNGVSFMRESVEWHYKHLSDDDYARAMAEISI